jgi:hypothetical protein
MFVEFMQTAADQLSELKEIKAMLLASGAVQRVVAAPVIRTTSTRFSTLLLCIVSDLITFICTRSFLALRPAPAVVPARKAMSLLMRGETPNYTAPHSPIASSGPARACRLAVWDRQEARGVIALTTPVLRCRAPSLHPARKTWPA